MTFAVFATEDDADRAQQALSKLYRAAAVRLNDDLEAEEPGAGTLMVWAAYRNGQKIDGETVRWRRPRQALVQGGGPTVYWVVRVPSNLQINGVPLLSTEVTARPVQLTHFTEMPTASLDIPAFISEMGIVDFDPNRPETFTVAQWSRGFLAAMGIPFVTQPDNNITLQ